MRRIIPYLLFQHLLVSETAGSIDLHRSIEGRGLFLTHINYIGWLPLSDISSPERTAELIAAEEARIALDLASCNPRPGLREQYDLQLEMLKDPEAVDTEFILVPFYFPSPTGMCSHLSLS